VLVCSELQEDQLIFATDADVIGSIARLIAAKAIDSATDFKLREQSIGFNYEEHGLLFDMALRGTVLPVSQYCHDWMHGIFAGGVFNICAFLFFEAVHGLMPLLNVWETFHTYMQTWRWPKSLKYQTGTDASTFSHAKVKAYRKAGCVKASASEGLFILPIIAMFAINTVLPSGLCNAESKAMICLCDIVEAMQATSLRVTSADHLRKLIRSFMELCVEAGWRDRMIPKFHWMIHYPAHLERYGTLVTCFVHERKHK
jgi:hypothetical protein